MSATQQTKNLKLPVYAETDFTTWQDFNDAMEIIDTAYEKNAADMESNTTEIQNNSNAIATLQEAVKNNTNSAESNNTQIAALSNRMSGVEAKNTNQDASINTLNTEIEQIQNQIGNLPSNLEETLKGLQTKNEQQDTAIATAQSEADTATQTANTANTNAQSALSKATTANENATNAITLANEANNKLNQIQYTPSIITSDIGITNNGTTWTPIQNAKGVVNKLYINNAIELLNARIDAKIASAVNGIGVRCYLGTSVMQDITNYITQQGGSVQGYVETGAMHYNASVTFENGFLMFNIGQTDAQQFTSYVTIGIV